MQAESRYEQNASLNQGFEYFFVKNQPVLNANSVVWVALSGGIDSVVLLHLAHQFFKDHDVTLKVLHVNHGISLHANQWQAFCEQMCAKLQLELIVRTVEVPKTGNLEQHARTLRYQAFLSHCKTGDRVLLAHHANDQAETLLFRLLRGMHVQSLSGIPETRLWQGLQLLRPLLLFSRKQIEAYATQHGLAWVEDDSNHNLAFSRNLIRLQVIPQLEQQVPDLVARLSALARNVQKQVNLFEAVAARDLMDCCGRDGHLNSWGSNLDLNSFSALTRERQENLIRFLLTQHVFPFPAQKAITYLLNQCASVMASESDSLEVCWQNGQRKFLWRVFENHLFYELQSDDLLDKKSSDAVLLAQDVREFSGFGYWRYQITPLFQSSLQIHPVHTFRLVCRSGGERCKPVGRVHSQSLKKLLQEYRIPVWERDTLPLVYQGEHLLAVADLWICDGFAEGLKQSDKLLKRIRA